MFSGGLKANIIINLIFLLSTGMILIDVVMMVAFQTILIRSEISKGYLLLSAIETNIETRLTDVSEQDNNVMLTHGFREYISNIDGDSLFSCVLVLDRDVSPLYCDGTHCELKEELDVITQKALYSGKKIAQRIGITWGVFWKQRQNVIVASPIFLKGDIVGSAGIIMHLDGIYVMLRRIHHILLIYIFLNILILTLLGFHQLSKVTLKPVNRLLKRAEEYHDEQSFFFLNEKEGNEFSKLSKALNRMLNRISDDKESLQDAVLSLENANLELKQAQKEIIRAEKMASVGRLSAGIAHEIGNPISIVMGYLDLLKRNDISEDEKIEFIGRTESEVYRINEIIRQLLDFSRPASDDRKTVSVHEIIQETAAILRLQPLMTNIELKQELAAENDMVFANSNQLRQVFLNFIMNAADAVLSSENKENGKIVIRTEIEPISPNSPPSPLSFSKRGGESEAEGGELMGNDDQCLKIMFIDNGCGISRDNLDVIFDPFYTTKEPGKGTGLGLSVSLMIIESINGTIQAKSEENQGTTMIIHLPLYQPEASNDCQT